MTGSTPDPRLAVVPVSDGEVITGTIVERTPEQWADIIRDDLSQAVIGFIAAGQHLKQVRDVHKHLRNGEGFVATCRELGISHETARWHIKNGEYYPPLLRSYPTLVGKLPRSWRTMGELTALDPAVLVSAAEAGDIHPELDRRAASALVLECGRDAVIGSPAALRRARPRDRLPVAGCAEPVRPGDWWQLGRHLLYCGDSAGDEFTSRAQGASFAFADPPYNAGKAAWDHDFTWKHDWLAEAARIVTVTPGILATPEFVANTTRMPFRWTLIAWISNGMTRSPVGRSNYIPVSLFSHERSVCQGMQDHFSIAIRTSDPPTIHQARKPFALLGKLLKAFTAEGDLVVDPFLGSGTTLLAAQREGRRCIGAEIVPEFCAEIIAQYIARYDPDAKPLSEPPPLAP